MADVTPLPNSDPRHHTRKIRQMLTGIIKHTQKDVGKVTDPTAQALFEATAQILTDLRKAYEDFELYSDPSPRTPSKPKKRVI